MFNIIIDAVVTAALTVSGAACDAGTFIADTAVYAADTVSTAACDTVDTVGCWIDEITNGMFGSPETDTLEETGTDVKPIQVEDIQVETILYEDVTETWPD